MDPRRELLKWSRSQERALQREAEYKVNAGKRRVAQVIHAVNLDHINVLRVEPVAGPRVNESESIATVLEAVIPVIGLAHTKRVLLPKAGLETLGRNTAAAVAGSVPFLLCVFLFRLDVLLLLRRWSFLLLSGLFGLRFFLFLGRLGSLFVLVLLLCEHRSRRYQGQRHVPVSVSFFMSGLTGALMRRAGSELFEQIPTSTQPPDLRSRPTTKS